MADAIIELRAVSKAFGPVPVLRRLELTVARGEFLGLLGPNGSGKSTLLRLLCGLSSPTGGTIRIGGWELPREAAAVRAQIGLVSHKPLLYESLTARENLEFFARLYGLPQATKKERIDYLLEKVGLAHRAQDRIRTFSRGMQQRLSIARAMLHDPHILLLDEPYTGLDQEVAEALNKLLQDAHGSGHTIIMVSHQADRTAALASRIVILSRGVIAHDAPTKGLDPLTLAATYSRAISAVPAQ
jgi:heme exporter protein A